MAASVSSSNSNGDAAARSRTSTASAARIAALSNGSKLAAAVADLIVADIAARGWPKGQVLGSEAELLERYEVSRAVFREAVRLLEHLHVARMRRGPGGGLVVLNPSIDSVTDAVTVYLNYVGAGIEEVFRARMAVEEIAAELAAERVQERDIERLREITAEERAGRFENPRQLHHAVAKVTRNPALVFFVEILNRITHLYLPQSPRFTKVTAGDAARAHSAIVEAIVAGDASLARSRMRKHLIAEAQYLRSRRPSRRQLAEHTDSRDRSNKRAEQLTWEIFSEVSAAGWPVGQLLGSESDLTKRYDVSRAVLREAVRVLEHHQVAYMRRGPSGGLFVAKPGVEAVTEAIALQVDRLGMEPQHLFEVRAVVEMAVLEEVVTNLDESAVTALQEALALERETPPQDFESVGHDLHAVLAHVSGNRMLELLTLVLLRLTRTHVAMPQDAPVTESAGVIIDVHGRLVDAILDGDLGVARHRMRRHLDDLMRWMQWRG